MFKAMVLPRQYFWDNDGNSLALGKVYFYQAGTLIPKDTFTSEAGDTPNPNPVILNSEGYASIYLDGSYAIVVDDADDANIWSVDPYTTNVTSEWTNRANATYLSPTSFKFIGDQTEIYEANRRVRINNGIPTFSYSNIDSSSFAAGETTVIVNDAVVAVGITSVETTFFSQSSNFISVTRVPGTAIDWAGLQKSLLSDLETFVGVNGQQVTTSGRTAIGDGGGGTFIWDSSDLSTEVTADTESGIYVAPTSDTTGASGAWVRQYSGDASILWFGASASATDNRAAIQATIDTAASEGVGVYVPNGTYLLKPETTLGRILRINSTNLVITGESKYGAILKVAATDANGQVMNDAGGTTVPDGYIAIFTNYLSTTDVSGFRLSNIKLDMNAEDNHLVEGYGNLDTVEPLEGAYPGTSGLGFARFRAGVYILKGSDIQFNNVVAKNPQRVGLLVEGAVYGDVARATADECHIEITVSNPGTQEWDVTGILFAGAGSSCMNSKFTNTAVGTDYYLARTATQISGANVRVTGNSVDRWYRVSLVGNGPLDAVSDSVVVSNNTGTNLQRNIQLLSRTGTVILAGGNDSAIRGVVVSGNTARFTLDMALNNPTSSDLTGISMLEIETLGLDSILINDNVHIYPANATYGNSAIHISPVGTGTHNLTNITIKDNLAVQPPANGIFVGFGDEISNLNISGNTVVNPGQLATAADRQKAGIQVRGILNRVIINNNLLIDDSVTHNMTAGVWVLATAGSGDIETIGNSLYLKDGVYDIPLVENENSNANPVIGGIVPVFVLPTSNAGNGSSVVETSTRLTYTCTGGTTWASTLGLATPIFFVSTVDLDTTPSVKGWTWGRVGNTGSTTVTQFDDGHEGQKMSLMFSTGFTTVAHGTNIYTKTGANVTPSPNTTMSFSMIAGKWYEI
jgi:hypothetical protein